MSLLLTPRDPPPPDAPPPDGPPPPAWRRSLRWPLRLFVATLVALVIGVWLFPAGKTAFIVALAAAAGWLAWTFWDATRGAGAALDARRASFAAALEAEGGVMNGEDLHVMEDGQPLIVRVGQRDGRPTATVLTPLSESTTAFRFWPHAMPRPSFDGGDPPVGGPLLTRLHALETVLGGGFEVEGNEPTHIMRWIDEALLAALLDAAHSQPAAFRGLTFDGRFLAVHWIGGPASDVHRALALSSRLWRPFVPRLPALPPSLMH